MPKEKFPILESEENTEEKADPKEDGEIERLEFAIDELERQNETLLKENRGLNLEVEDLKREVKEAKELATKDPKTGAYNVRGLKELLEKITPDAFTGEDEKREGERRRKKKISLLVLDIDNFKQINDIYGHNVGDSVLRQFVKEIGGELRKSDILARVGGEEFAIVFNGTDAQKVIDKYFNEKDGRAEVSFKSGIAGHEFTITLSGGVSDWETGDTLETCMERSDSALYNAKHAGKDRIMKYDDTQKEKTL